MNPSLGYPAPPHAQFRLAKFTTLPEFPTPDYAVRFSFASMATLPDAVTSLKARMPDNLLDQIDAKASTHPLSLTASHGETANPLSLHDTHAYLEHNPPKDDNYIEPGQMWPCGVRRSRDKSLIPVC